MNVAGLVTTVLLTLRCRAVLGACAFVALAAGASMVAGAEPEPPARAASSPPAEQAESNYQLPAIEIVGFEFLLNRTNRYFGSDRNDYRVTIGSIKRRNEAQADFSID